MKKVQVKRKNKKTADAMQDCVIFMTAYNINTFDKKLSFFRKKGKSHERLAKYHMSSLLAQNTLLTQKGKIKYTAQFDPLKQTTNFQFKTDKKEDGVETHKDEIDRVSWAFKLMHSLELLLDNSLFNISFFINMEQFLVSINSRLLQVDPIVFFFNGMLFINFELIDFSTGNPIGKDEIYGRNNNYCLMPVSSLRYFNEDEFSDDTRKISDIIFENVAGFFEQGFHIKSVSYVHNIFVRSNSIANMNDYFLGVLGATGLQIKLNNINTNDGFKYYSQEYLGVVTAVSSGNEQQSLFDCQMLEVLKMYLGLSQIVNYNVVKNLDDTINGQMRVEHLLFMSSTPIITVNAIDNMKQTESFKRNKAAIDFKITCLNLWQERRKNKNAFLLNILLYALTFVGGLSALQVLQDELGWCFKPAAAIMTIIFAGAGAIWFLLERKK